MFIFKKRNIIAPEFIEIGNIKIKVVNSFKLLGITLDDQLSFLKHAKDLKLAVNRRLYSIERIYHLSFEVKLQFFKTFILPHFVYCMTLLIYYPKETIQKLANYYNFCIYKLFKINPLINDMDDFNMLNLRLERFNLNTFVHRLIYRLSTFIYYIFNKQVILELSSSFKYKYEHQSNYHLRNRNSLIVPSIGKYNNYFKNSFPYFFSKLINELLINDLKLSESTFKTRVKNNINYHFL